MLLAVAGGGAWLGLQWYTQRQVISAPPSEREIVKGSLKFKSSAAQPAVEPVPLPAMQALRAPKPKSPL